jgi:hypothetical protein
MVVARPLRSTGGYSCSLWKRPTSISPTRYEHINPYGRYRFNLVVLG